MVLGLVRARPAPSPRPGRGSSAAATAAASALAHTAPAGTGTPGRRSSRLARGLVEHAARPLARARPSGPATGAAAPGPAQAWPIVAAASTASMRDARAGRAPAARGGPSGGPLRRPGSPPSRPPARRAPGAGAGPGNAVIGQRPVVVGAAVGPRQVGEQQVQVGRAAHHGRERRRHGVQVAPDVGVVVERVGQRHPFAEHRAQLRRAAGRSARRTGPPAERGVRDQRGLAARAAQRGQPGAGQRAAAVQQASAPSSASTELTSPIPLRRRNSDADRGVARQRGRCG